MGRAKPYRNINGEVYHHYMFLCTKRDANAEAGKMRRTGAWKARVVKVKDGYIIFSRPKTRQK